MSTVLELAAVSKTFQMHLQGGIRLPVVSGVAFDVKAGECAVLAGPSGAGKSSILKMIFGTYRCDFRQHRRPAWRRRRRRRNCRAPTDSGVAPQCARLCQPVSARCAARGGDRCGRGAVGDCRRRADGAPGRRRPICCRGSTSRSGFGRCRRRRFRAVSSSASTSRAVLCPICRFFFWTSPPLRSTPVTARSWSTWCPKKSGAARPSSRSCTTKTCARRSPTPSLTLRGSPRRP